MANCTYCGKPAGFLWKFHKTCRERHDSAVAKIPELFTKLLSSAIPVERFRELLLGAAEASYIRPKQLRSLILKGVIALLEMVLNKRLLTADEQARIANLLETLDIPFDSSLRPYEMLLKVEMLHELEAGQIPERVNLVDPLPMVLQDDEKIVWTFNHVISYVDATASGAETESALVKSSAVEALSGYFGLNPDETLAISAESPGRDAKGDLLVTSHHLYLLSLQEEPRRIPIRKIMEVQYYKNGFRVVYGSLKRIARVVVIEDSWFAANLVSALRHHYARRVDGDGIKEG